MPTTRHVRVYLPGFLSWFSPAVCVVPAPAPPSPTLYMAPVLASPSIISANPYIPQPYSGSYSWHGASTIGNATPDSNANTFVALALPTLTVVGPPLEVALPTTAPNSNNTLPVFYTTQELEATFFEDPELTMPRMPIAPDRPKRGIKLAVGK